MIDGTRLSMHGWRRFSCAQIDLTRLVGIDTTGSSFGLCAKVSMPTKNSPKVPMKNSPDHLFNWTPSQSAQSQLISSTMSLALSSFLCFTRSSGRGAFR
jgi:hypothetical protein